MAWEHVVINSTARVVRALAPGSICSRKEALNSSRARGVSEGKEGFRVKVVGGPRRRRWAGFGAVGGAIKETVTEKTQTTKGINGKGKYLSACSVECCDICNGSATKLRLCFLIVPVLCCGSRGGMDTLRSRGRFGDDNVDGKIVGVGKGSSGAVGV